MPIESDAGKGELLAEGRHKKVYRDGEKTVAEFKPEKFHFTERQMKGIFWMRKILQLIMPENFPKIRLSASDNPRIESEYIETDLDHNRLQALWGKHIRNERKSFGEHQEYEALAQKIKRNPDVENLKIILHDLFLDPDTGKVNFAFNQKTGRVMYMENDLVPWRITLEGKVVRAYQEGLLLGLISQLDDNKKAKALVFLNRLKILENEEVQDQLGKYISVS